MLRHLRNGRRFEKSRDLELDLRHVVDMAENAGGQQRVPARREEVIVYADLLEAKDLRPAFRQRAFEWSPWRHKGPPRCIAIRKPEFIRQPDPLDLAGWALGDFLDDDDLARDLEFGNTPDGELTNV